MEIDLIQYVRVYAHYIVHILCIYIMIVIVIICSDYLVLSRTPTVRDTHSYSNGNLVREATLDDPRKSRG